LSELTPRISRTSLFSEQDVCSEQYHRIRRPIVRAIKSFLHNREIEKFVTIITEMNK